MQSRGTTPRIWTDTTDLVELYNHRGPFITVHLPTPGNEENAAQHNEAGWESWRRDLAAAGATEDALLNIDDLIANAHEKAVSVYVIAGEKEVYHSSYWNTPLLRPFAELSALPKLAPLLDLRQGVCSYITVVADRTGADITGVMMGNEVAAVDHAGGTDGPIRKVNAGGWSQLRYHHRAEDTWVDNAKDVVARLTDMVEKVHPRVVFVAGDVRAVEKIQRALPTQLNYGAALEVVDGSRGNDGGEAISEEAIQRCLAKLEMEDTLALNNKLAKELGEHDRAAVGAVGIISALQKTQVETLLVELGARDDRMVWVGPDAPHIAENREDVQALGTSDVIQVPLIDGALRSAFLSDAKVRVVPRMEKDNQHLAAILRWA